MIRVGCAITITIVEMVQMKAKNVTRNIKLAQHKNSHVKISNVYVISIGVMAKMIAVISQMKSVAVSLFQYFTRSKSYHYFKLFRFYRKRK